MKQFNLKKDISREDAELILMYMQDILDTYGFVTLADFYDLAGSRVIAYTDNKKGWNSLTGARVSRKDGRYRIELPDLKEFF